MFALRVEQIQREIIVGCFNSFICALPNNLTGFDVTLFKKLSFFKINIHAK
jgi:hypothetical protein